MQAKFPLEFMNPKSELVEVQVYTRPASNVVRKELQFLERKLQVFQMQFSKDLAKNHPNIFALQKENQGDFDKLLEMQDKLSIDEFETVIKLNESLADYQNQILLEEIVLIIDVEKSRTSSKMKDYQLHQLNSIIGDTTTIPIDDPEQSDIEFDFWNNQDLSILRDQKAEFFRRVGI